MNKSVGEQELILNGRSYLLRPDFSALERIETLTSKTILGLMATFSDAAYLSAKDIIYILYSTALSGCKSGEKIDLKEFGQGLVDKGVYENTEMAVEMVRFVMTGGKKKPADDQREQLKVPKTLNGETSTTQP